MIEPTKQNGGVPSAIAICDDCGTSKEIACGYEKGKPNHGQIISRLKGQDWAYVKRKLRCPECEIKRKGIPMETAKETQAIVDAREPTKAQRREIISMLTDVYDIDGERYRQGDTDDSVADVLSVMPGWVAEIRDDLFGPDGGNEDIDALVAELADWRAVADAFIADAAKVNDAVLKSLDEVKGFEDRLSKIKAAVGPRTLKKAGV